MTGLVPHVLFFLALSFVIVVMGAFYTEAEDARAFRSIPKRYFVFVTTCAGIAAVMLVAQALFASV